MSRTQDDAATSIELFNSLRKVAASVNSDLSLEMCLQTVVDVVCDLTSWQICWINAVDVTANHADVVVRRDKLEYSPQSRQQRWMLEGSPTLDAINSGQPVLITDAQSQQTYPDYAADARLRGYTSGVVLPLNAHDVHGRPMVLSVQSDQPLLDDPRQLPFLRTVAEMASLAARNARQIATTQSAFSAIGRSQSAHADLLEALIRGTSTVEALDLVQATTSESMVILDSADRIMYNGRNPRPEEWDAAEWHQRSEAAAHEAIALVGGPSGAAPQRAFALKALAGLNVWLRVNRIGEPSQVVGTAVFLRESEVADVPPAALSQLHSSVATVLLRDVVLYRTEAELGMGIVDPLLSGSWKRREEMLARASSIDLHLDQPMHVVAIRSSAPHSTSDWDALVRSLRPTVGNWTGARLVRAGDGAAVFIPQAAIPEVKFLSTALQSLLAASERVLKSKTSVSHAGPARDLEDYPRAWRECEIAIDLAENLQQHGVVCLDDFGAYRFLLAASAAHDVDHFIAEVIGVLLDYDETHRTQLVDTTERFIASGGKYQETADRLHVHVSTLRYRLDRVAELCGRDLADEDSRFEIMLATRLHRLRSSRLGAMKLPADGLARAVGD